MFASIKIRDIIPAQNLPLERLHVRYILEFEAAHALGGLPPAPRQLVLIRAVDLRPKPLRKRPPPSPRPPPATSPGDPDPNETEPAPCFAPFRTPSMCRTTLYGAILTQVYAQMSPSRANRRASPIRSKILSGFGAPDWNGLSSRLTAPGYSSRASAARNGRSGRRPLPGSLC